MDFRNLTRAFAGLECSRPTPLHLELHGGFSAEALKVVLDHWNEFSTVYVELPPSQPRLFYQHLLAPSAEASVLSVDPHHRPERIGVNTPGGFMSLCRFLVSGFFILIDRITDPNLIHLPFEGMELSLYPVPNLLQRFQQLEAFY